MDEAYCQMSDLAPGPVSVRWSLDAYVEECQAVLVTVEGRCTPILKKVEHPRHIFALYAHENIRGVRSDVVVAYVELLEMVAYGEAPGEASEPRGRDGGNYERAVIRCCRDRDGTDDG